MGGRKFERNVCTLLDGLELKLIPNFIPHKEGKLRKLVYFPDREDKVRIVAELDYFSQSVLRPLHLYLFNVLRKIPQDCTHSQGSGLNRLKLVVDKEIYSVDLSNATDRFPISLIKTVLSGKFPS